MPMYYIGSTSLEKINQGYGGSVKSKKYRNIWTKERQNNIHLFKTIIITNHFTRKEALSKELIFQRQLNVMISPMYINQSIAAPNGFFGTTTKGKEHHNYGKKHSQETRNKISVNRKGKRKGIKRLEETIRKMSETQKGRKLTEEHKNKLSIAHKGKIPWNKGIPASDLVKEKISKANKCNKYSLGRKHSDSVKEKISKANKGHKYNLGKKHSEETKQKIREKVIEYLNNKKITFESVM